MPIIKSGCPKTLIINKAGSIFDWFYTNGNYEARPIVIENIYATKTIKGFDGRTYVLDDNNKIVLSTYLGEDIILPESAAEIDSALKNTVGLTLNPWNIKFSNTIKKINNTYTVSGTSYTDNSEWQVNSVYYPRKTFVENYQLIKADKAYFSPNLLLDAEVPNVISNKAYNSGDAINIGYDLTLKIQEGWTLFDQFVSNLDENSYYLVSTEKPDFSNIEGIEGESVCDGIVEITKLLVTENIDIKESLKDLTNIEVVGQKIEDFSIILPSNDQND
jgi:hypothetical protein